MRTGFVALALGALILGYVGLRQFLESRPQYGTGVLDLIYWDLQLFVLDSAPLQTGGELPVALQIARFAAPAATLSALYATARAVLSGRITLVRARYARRHTIVCGTGPPLVFLAKRLVAEGRQVVMIEPEAPADISASGLPPQVLRLRGDPRDPEVLRAAAVRQALEVMALTTDSAVNGEIAVAVRALAVGIAPGPECYAEVADPALCAELAARAVGAGRSTDVQVMFFSRHDRAARRLLDRYPVAPVGRMASGDHVAVVIVGDGPLKDALIKELSRRWSQHTGVASDGPPLATKTASETFEMQTAAGLQVESGDNGRVTPSHVFICLDDDATAIRAGLKVSRLLGPGVRHLVVATPVSTVFGRELAGVVHPAEAMPTVETGPSGSARLTFHNVTETVYAPEALRRGDVEDIARAAHDAYVNACRNRGETPETNPSMVPWDALPDFKREDNRDQAADIGRKLAAIGATVVPALGHEAPIAFDDDEVELLAHMEHDRWLRRRRAGGWSYAAVKNETARQHPDVVSWDELTERSRDKDRSAVREIPGQLRTAGFAIVRGII
jgi:voltage-gated potassium channel Kch